MATREDKTREDGIDNALLIWISTFHPERPNSYTYDDLNDGAVLCDVMQQIYPKPDYQRPPKQEGVENWDCLRQHITSFYQERGEEVPAAWLRNVPALSTSPESSESKWTMEKLLQLILCSAVRCDENERYIKGIQCLEPGVQCSLKQYIQAMEPCSEEADKSYRSLTSSQSTPASSMSSWEYDFSCDLFSFGRSSKSQLITKLTEANATGRRLQQELIMKEDFITDLESQLDEERDTLKKVKKRNIQLQVEARSAHALRDEVDELKQQLDEFNTSKPSREPSEMRKKVVELQQLIQVLRDDNLVLKQTTETLEAENRDLHVNKQRHLLLEKELARAKLEMEQLTKENEQYLEEVHSLRQTVARCQQPHRQLTRMQPEADVSIGEDDVSISVIDMSPRQMNAEPTDGTRVLSLELENERLRQKLSQLKGDSGERLTQSTTNDHDCMKETPERETTLTSSESRVQEKGVDSDEMRDLKTDLERMKLSNDTAEQQVVAMQSRCADYRRNEAILRKKVLQGKTDYTALEKEYARLRESWKDLQAEHEHCSSVIAALQNMLQQTTLEHTLLQQEHRALKRSRDARSKMAATRLDKTPASGHAVGLECRDKEAANMLDEWSAPVSERLSRVTRELQEPDIGRVAGSQERGANELTACMRRDEEDRGGNRKPAPDTQLAPSPEKLRPVSLMTSPGTPPSLDCLVRQHGLADGHMQVFVKTLTGKTITLMVQAGESVESVKGKVEDKIGILPLHQRLVYGCKQLVDGHVLSEYQVQPNSTLHVTTRLHGGADHTTDQETDHSSDQHTDHDSDQHTSLTVKAQY